MIGIKTGGLQFEYNFEFASWFCPLNGGVYVYELLEDDETGKEVTVVKLSDLLETAREDIEDIKSIKVPNQKYRICDKSDVNIEELKKSRDLLNEMITAVENMPDE